MVKYIGLSTHRISLFRNLKSTLSLATNQAELTKDDLFLLPLNLRPPSLRRDHWQPFLILDSFSNDEITKEILTLLQEHDSPIPRHHRTFDPVISKLQALTKALELVPSVWKEPKLKAHWEYMELKDQFVKQYQYCFPSNITHHVLTIKAPSYYDRIEKYWESKPVPSTSSP